MSNKLKQSSILRVVQIATRIGEQNHLSPSAVRSMIQFTFTNKELAPEQVDYRFVASNLEAILLKYDNMYGSRASF